MRAERLMTRPCTLVTVTQTEDAWGTPTDQATESDALCELQQFQRSEGGPDEWQVAKWRLFLPPGTPVTGLDRVAVDGTTFRLDGPPWPVRNPRTGVESHIEATVEVAT